MNQKGFVLPVAALLSILLLAGSLATLGRLAVFKAAAARAGDSLVAFHAAEAGIDLAIWRLNLGQPINALEEISLDVWAEVSLPAAGVLESIGVAGRSRRKIRVEIIFDESWKVSKWAEVIQ